MHVLWLKARLAATDAYHAVLSCAQHGLSHCCAVLQEVEDLDKQLRLMSDAQSALATANGMRQLTINDKGRASNKISAHSVARKVPLSCMGRPAVRAVAVKPKQDGAPAFCCPQVQQTSAVAQLLAIMPCSVGQMHHSID